MSTPVDRYYKYYSLSGVPSKLLKNEEHFNLHIRPKKEKKSEQPKVIVLDKVVPPDVTQCVPLPADSKQARSKSKTVQRSKAG